MLSKSNEFRQIPFHLDAEQGVLGGIFLAPYTIYQVMDRLDVDDFYDEKHKLIYSVMLIIEKEGLKINFNSVIAKLEQFQNLGKVGGIEYIMELSKHVAAINHLDSDISLVLDASLKRKMIETALKIAEKGKNPEISANDYLEDAEAIVFEIAQKRRVSELIKIKDVLNEIREKLETKKDRNSITGIKTGFIKLDEITSGFQPEELIILAARPSMGKSAFALNMGLNVANNNKDSKAYVAIFSLEMSNDQLVSRMISSTAEIDGMRLKSGNLDPNEWAHFNIAKTVLEKQNILFDDSAAVKISDIRAKCRKLKKDDKLDFVIIDYLQLIKEESHRGNRQEEVSRISRGLKQLARELKIPVLALSQLSRSVESRDDKRPLLSDLRESGSIEQDADIVMFLYRQDYYEKDPGKKTGEVDLIISKNRHGASGIDLKFKFNSNISKFETNINYNEE